MAACDIRTLFLAADADTGIDETVREIDKDIRERNEHGVEDRGAHNDGVVALRDRLDELAAEPRRTKDRLNDDRAGDEIGSRRSEDCNYWDQGIPQHVCGDNVPAGQALGA